MIWFGWGFHGGEKIRVSKWLFNPRFSFPFSRSLWEGLGIHMVFLPLSLTINIIGRLLCLRPVQEQAAHVLFECS